MFGGLLGGLVGKRVHVHEVNRIQWISAPLVMAEVTERLDQRSHCGSLPTVTVWSLHMQ